jgi:ATP-binding cassette subfamily F protein 3
MLEKLEIIEVDEEDTSALNIKFPPSPRSGNIVLEARELSVSYGTHQVLREVELNILRGEKVAFIGRNGEGKTTFTKIISGELPFSGHLKIGHNVKTGYFAQNQDELLDGNKTVLSTLEEVATGDIRTKIRDILGAFLFSGEDVDKKVKVLSGGERSRLAMAKLLLEPCNVLILDEPTNHLDMRSKDILKKALLAYDGTLIAVSHDREFLDGLISKVFEFSNKKIKEHIGGIFEFLEKKKIQSLSELQRRTSYAESGFRNETSSRQAFMDKKDFEREIRKIENRIAKNENDIAVLEEQIKVYESQISGPEIDPESMKSPDFFSKYESMKSELTKQMETWEQLHKELDQMKNKRN